MPPRFSMRQALALTMLIVTAPPAFSQRTNDAGTLLREQPKPPTLSPSAPIQLQAPANASVKPDAGPKIKVSAFVFEGAVLIAPSELAARFEPQIGKELSFLELQALASSIAALYAERGYLARVVLPPQDIKDGRVTFRIIEGKLGSLILRPSGERIDSGRIRGLIEYRIHPGEPMSFAELGTAIGVLNEQPGIKAQSTLVPGKNERESDVVVTANEKPLIGGMVQINDHGSKGTGVYQTQGMLMLSNPSGRFDAASLLVNANEGSTYARVDYSLLAHDAGLRLGVNASSMRYSVIPSALNILDAHGQASTYGLTATLPIVRSSALQLTLQASYDNKRLIDQTIAGETGNREVNTASLGVTGRLEPGAGNPLAGGILGFGASLGLGDSHQRNAGALAVDRQTRRVEGGYSKASYSLSYLRPLDDRWNLSTSLRGQVAFDNLDSSDGFGLGGPSGVRAYAAGDGGGDAGWVLNINAQRLINEQLLATIFFDAGGIQLHHKTWTGWNAGNPRLPNRYELYGVGTSIDWRFMPSARLNATLGIPLIKNPGRDINGNSADGKSTRPHLWLSVNAEF